MSGPKRPPFDAKGWAAAALPAHRDCRLLVEVALTEAYDAGREDVARGRAAVLDLCAALENAMSVIEQLIPEPSARGVADVVLVQGRAALVKVRGEP